MAAALFSGYATIATTGTEVQLRSTGNTVKWFRIIAPLSNEFVVVVGPTGVTDDKTTTTAGYTLAPGKELPLAECETDTVYINGKAGDEVYFIAGTS